MALITSIAKSFFDACETGKGWEVCRAYCSPNATFTAQAEPLLDVKTLEAYCDWMKGVLIIMPDGAYEVKSLATDTEHNSVAVYAVSDYVYVMQFSGEKISHMTKIWHAGLAMKELGWV
jgi:phosphoribosyl 1,2-cyclic phosphodiesterase